MSPILYVHVMLAGVFIALAIMLNFFPPSKINPLYGYRTKRSMENDDTWKAANEFSNRIFVRLVAGTLAIQLVMVFALNPVVSLFLAIGVFLAGIIVMMVLTERYLKKRFG